MKLELIEARKSVAWEQAYNSDVRNMLASANLAGRLTCAHDNASTRGGENRNFPVREHAKPGCDITTFTSRVGRAEQGRGPGFDERSSEGTQRKSIRTVWSGKAFETLFQALDLAANSMRLSPQCQRFIRRNNHLRLFMYPLVATHYQEHLLT